MCTKQQVATLEQQKLTATGLGGSLGHCEGHGRDKAGSTPPVVPGAAPALAKAGVGGYMFIIYGLELYFIQHHQHLIFTNIFTTFAVYLLPQR